MGAIDTTYTFTATDTITSTKMNNIIDQTTITTDAISGTTLEVTGTGKLKVRAQGITSNELATGAVTTTAITAGSVTPTKLSANGPSWTSTATGGVFGVPQSGIELGTGTVSNFGCFVDFHSAVTPTDFECRLVRDGGANGNFNVINTGTGAIALSSAGGVTFGSANMPVPSGTAPIFGVRAWVNFNGKTADNINGTYSRTLTTVTVTTSVHHGLIVGHKVFLDFTSGSASDGAFVVTGITSNTVFTVTHGTSGAASGNVTLNRRLIRASGNVANVSLLGTGQYAVNFTTALPDANYARSGFANYDTSGVAGLVGGNNATTTTAQSCDIFTANSTSGAEENFTVVNAMFVG